VTKTHNTGTDIFLWDVIPSCLSKAVFDNVCTVLLNLRIRRQHEVEAGKEWMDRAKELSTTEENFYKAGMRKILEIQHGVG
jgi:DNA-directed RNA polymerase III subunit RPC3